MSNKDEFDDIKQVSFNTNTELVPHQPAPKEDDYDTGYVNRYFARIVNDISAPIIEINKYQFQQAKRNPLFLTTLFRWKIKQMGSDPVNIETSNSLILEKNETVLPGIRKKLPVVRQFDKTLPEEIKVIVSRRPAIIEEQVPFGINDGDGTDVVVPDTTPPQILSANITTESPANIVLTYDELLDPNSVPLPADYSVNLGKSVLSVSVSGVTVTITVDSDYVESDAGVTITYVEGVTALQDLAGNNAANLTDYPVTNNVIDDVIAPILTTATVEDAAASDIVLTYDESLDGTSVPATGDFSVSGGKSVSTISISGNVVTITVDSDYVIGDVITITYTAGANPIQDTAGNDAANLTNEPVTNNTLSKGFPYEFDFVLS